MVTLVVVMDMVMVTTVDDDLADDHHESTIAETRTRGSSTYMYMGDESFHSSDEQPQA